MKIITTLIVFLGFIVSPAMAEPVAGLYESIAEVADESPEARVAGIKKSLQDVLIKVSGRKTAELQKKMASDQKLLMTYIQEYRYLPPLETEQETDSALPRLNVVFDKRGINRWLNKQHLAVWSDQRPVVLVWSATEVKGKRAMDVAEFDQVLTTVTDQVSSKRGIPFILPLMDLQDRSALSASDLWAGFDDKLQEASGRYHADVLVSVRLKKISRNQWQGQWRQVFAGSVQEWNVSGKTRANILNSGLNDVSDRLARQFATISNSSSENGQLMQVNGIYGMNQYNALIKFLDSRDAIASIAVRRVESDSILLFLSQKASLDALKNELRLGGLLREIPAPVKMPGSRTDKTNEASQVADTSIDSIMYYQFEQ